MRAPSRSELIGDFADYLSERLDQGDRYIDPDLQLLQDPSEIDAAALRRVAAALAPMAAPDPDTLALWFGQFITRYRSAGEIAPPPRPPSASSIASRLAAGARLHRHPLARVAWTRQADTAIVFIDGEQHHCSVAFARRLCDATPLTGEEFHRMEPAQQAVMAHLVHRGRYAVSRPPRAVR
jgi:50S ribosomal protein L16 3-hydroxylase